MKQVSGPAATTRQRKAVSKAASKANSAAGTMPSAAAILAADATGSLADQAYQRIEEMIITLQLPPGTVLSEHGLSEALGIGRTPIREALQRLAGEGLVLVLPKRGVLVSETSLLRQLRLLELRREVQRLLARLAAERATPEECARFKQMNLELLKAAEEHDETAFAVLDRELDEHMWQSARNEFIVKTMALMRGLSRRFWFEHYRRTGDLPLAATLHARIAEAIGKGDGKAAAAASDRLVDYIESFARETVDK